MQIKVDRLSLNRWMQIVVILATFSLLLLVFAGKTYADGGTSDCLAQIHNAIPILDPANYISEGTLGDAISDGFYDSEPDVLNTGNLSLGPDEVSPGSGAGQIEPEQFPGPHLPLGGLNTMGNLLRETVPNSCNLGN